MPDGGAQEVSRPDPAALASATLIERADSSIVVAAWGEIDMDTAAIVGDVVTEAISKTPAGGVIVDLSGVTFLDSSGITMLVTGHHDAWQRRVWFTVTGARDVVRRALEVTGVVDILNNEPREDLDTGRAS